MNCQLGHELTDGCVLCAYEAGVAAGQASMAAKNVQVQCSTCLGEGRIPHYRVVPTPEGPMVSSIYRVEDPFHMVSCPTCRSHGFVIATELKAVTQWAPPPPRDL